MSEIPEEIMGEAREFITAHVASARDDGWITSVNGQLIVARAILAERERCAGVANERAAQVFSAIESLPTTAPEFAPQLAEAMMIEQRIRDGRVPKETFHWPLPSPTQSKET